MLAAQNPFGGSAWVGGALAGGGIAVMHYTGMAAFEIMGVIAWDRPLVIASLLFAAGLGSAALGIGMRDGRLISRIPGAVLLTLAICSHHFTAMGAVTILPDPTVQISPLALPESWLALAVALVSGTVILLRSLASRSTSKTGASRKSWCECAA